MRALIESVREGRQYPGVLVVQSFADGALNRSPIDGSHVLLERLAGGLDPDDLAQSTYGAGLAARKALCLRSISCDSLADQKVLLGLDRP